MKKVAVIGAGISGLAAASLLSRRHRVDLFEQEQRLGGHTNTVLVESPHGTVPLDTGFLVHNDRVQMRRPHHVSPLREEPVDAATAVLEPAPSTRDGEGHVRVASGHTEFREQPHQVRIGPSWMRP